MTTARIMFRRLYDLAKELRVYAKDWDWKYGEEWDEKLENIDVFLREIGLHPEQEEDVIS